MATGTVGYGQKRGKPVARTKATNRVLTLEQRQAELLKQLKAARAADAKRQRVEDQRRKALLGAAIFATFKGPDLAGIIRATIPRTVKAAGDLALFKEWLNPPPDTALPLPAPPADKTPGATEPG